MSFQANGPFNAAIRSAGNRSRVLPDIPNIGQGPPPGQVQGGRPMPPPATQVPPPESMMPRPSIPQADFSQAPAPIQGGPPPPMAAPNIQPQTFTMHPPGTGADPTNYNYEPQSDGSWRVYPPGVTAPVHTFQASLPRAASTGDYIRMSRAFSDLHQQPQAQSPGPAPAPGQGY